MGEQMCKVGDKLYKVSKGEIIEIEIVYAEKMKLGHYVYKDKSRTSYFNSSFSKNIFSTKQEAEEYLDRQNRIAEKRALLKEYEKELNEKLNITDHIIVK